MKTLGSKQPVRREKVRKYSLCQIILIILKNSSIKNVPWVLLYHNCDIFPPPKKIPPSPKKTKTNIYIYIYIYIYIEIFLYLQVKKNRKKQFIAKNIWINRRENQDIFDHLKLFCKIAVLKIWAFLEYKP